MNMKGGYSFPDYQTLLDGKEPTGDSPEYKGPVALPEGEHTLRAVALKGDRYPSEAVSYNYVITPEESSAETQVDTADSGARIVSLATTTPGAVIYYTLDGSDPTVESSVYTPISPIELPDAGPAHQFTVKAVAMKTGSKGRLKSEVKSFTYSLGEEEKAPAVPGKITGLKTAVNAGKKTIKVGFVRLKNATDYQVSYRIAGAAKWKTLRTRGKTSATITGLKKDSLVQVKVAGVNGDVTGPASSLQYCLVGKTSLKVKAGRKSATVTLTRNKAASGYHVYYALKKNMAARKTATLKKLSKKGLKVKKLKAKKTYYFQAVPYRKYKGKTYVGEVTAVRKVKVKS